MSKTKKRAGTTPELLVPVGGWDQLEAAVANGADAVYLGGGTFHARSSAEPFSTDRLAEAIDFAHTYGVDVHIAMNILLRQEEVEHAAEQAVQLYEAGADALILQDWGLIARLREMLPDMPLHMSTQGSVYDLEGALAVQRMGLHRVILARELSLAEIQAICRAVDIQVETFVHGAICIGYSGQCHLSGTIGDRSGNRGSCAQPCRLPYTLEGGDGRAVSRGYLLSPADMGLLGNLRELAEAGVASLKIEGRLKSPEYVAVTTAAYRRQLDRVAAGEEASLSALAADLADMRQVFSRGPFTDAYLRGVTGGELMAADLPKHRGVPIGELLRLDRKRGHALVHLTGALANGDGVEIRGGDASFGNIVTYIRSKKGDLLPEATAGSTVTIGDFKGRLPEDLPPGAVVYRLSRQALLRQLQQSYEKQPARVPVDFFLEAAPGVPAVLKAQTRERGKTVEATASSSSPLDWADGRPLDEARARKSLEKTGGTPYSFRSLKTWITGDPFLPAAELNGMRRAVLEELTARRLEQRRRTRTGRPGVLESDPPGAEAGRPGVLEDRPPVTVLYFYPVPGIRARILECAREAARNGNLEGRLAFAVPAELLVRDGAAAPLAEELHRAGIAVQAVLPAITRGYPAAQQMALGGALEAMYEDGLIAGVYAANIGHLELLRRWRLPLLADVSLNVLNPDASRALAAAGLTAVTLSLEPDALVGPSPWLPAASAVARSEETGQPDTFGAGPASWSPAASAAGQAAAPALEAVVYGRTPAMYTAHCPVGGAGLPDATGRRPDCTPEKKFHYCLQEPWILRDRKGAAFPVTADDRTCAATIYSHRILNRVERAAEFRRQGVSRFRICVFDEPAEIIMALVKKIRIL